MNIQTFKTDAVTTSDALPALIDKYVPALSERSIFVVTSKIVSICEGSVIPKDQVPSKLALIKKSADAYLDMDKSYSPPHAIQLTLKNKILIPSAGIDESNGNGLYILYPKDVQKSAVEIWNHIRKRDNLSEVGVLITDSHTTPLRRGVIGIGLGWCGFKANYSYIGLPDCFGVPLKATTVNILDALAASAVFCMGEGNEQTPFCVIKNAPKIEFQSAPPSEAEINYVFIPMDEDLYAPLMRNAPWQSNK